MGALNVGVIEQIDSSILIERFKNGEINVFDEIVRRYQRQVYNLAYSLTQNCEDAYDISQEVFIKVYRSLKKIRKVSSFNLWLRRVTINACTDYLRQKPNERVLEDTLYIDKYYSRSNDDIPDELVETLELNLVVSKAVNRLPKRQRKVFILRHCNDMSLKEIAETLNCSLGTVKAHLFRAKNRLKNILYPYLL